MNATIAPRQLDPKTSYRCSVLCHGNPVPHATVMTGACIDATNAKVYGFASDRPLISVLGPVFGPDFVADPSLPF